MTREEFITRLPESINHWGRGFCKLEILRDNKTEKRACYISEKKFRVGLRSGSSWDLLYLRMVNFLEKEVFK